MIARQAEHTRSLTERAKNLTTYGHFVSGYRTQPSVVPQIRLVPVTTRVVCGYVDRLVGDGQS